MSMGAKIELVFNHIPRISQAASAAIAQQVEESAKNIGEDSRGKMRESKHGRVYIINGQPHQASAPGEAPAVLTGDLVDSIKEQKVNDLTWQVVSDGIQSWWEYGLRGYPARPYFRPAADKEKPDFVRGCKQAIKNG